MSLRKSPRSRNPIAIQLLSYKSSVKKNKKKEIPRKRRNKPPGIRG
jgi:hypothetical protein|tara:strand:- start:303 stop:440 length:138 start_codon:yes stop_codon:yes gene_type:complete